MTSLLRPRLSLLAITTLAVLGSQAGCGRTEPAAPPPPAVKLVSPRSQLFEDSAEYQSTLEAIREVKLAA